MSNIDFVVWLSAGTILVSLVIVVYLSLKVRELMNRNGEEK